MRRSPARSLLVAAAVASLVPVLFGCNLFGPDYEGLAGDASVDPATLVVRENLAYGLRREGGLLEVVAIEPSGKTTQVASRTTTKAGTTVSISTGGGPTEIESCCAFIYGTAAPGVVTAEVDSPQDGGAVPTSNGSWLILLEVNDIDPPLVEWQMLDAAGGTVESGMGPRVAP